MSKTIPVCPTRHEKWYNELIKGMNFRTERMRGGMGCGPGGDKVLYYTGLPPLKSKLGVIVENALAGVPPMTTLISDFIRPRLSVNDIPKTYQFEYWEPNWNQPGVIDLENGMIELQAGTLGICNSNKRFYFK